ncbi:MAG TPA: hypothetical protein VHT34_07605, partial [Clostridia bacterium]|nr:hypothetical protein [Clostridia bacterium]
GCIYSTTGDLYKFCKALDEKKLLAEYSGEEDYYGFGIETKKLKNKKRAAYHTGTVPGFSTGMYKFTEDDIIIIILSNNMATDAGTIASELSSCLD